MTVAGVWASKADLPSANSMICAGLLDGLIYLFAGQAGVGFAQSYDPATDSYTARASLSGAGAASYMAPGQAAAVANGLLYVSGGHTGVGATNCYAYDPAGDSWSSKTAMPGGKADHAFVNCDGTLYAIGGVYGSTAALYAYDPVGDAWSTKTSIPTVVGHPAAVAYKSKIYVIGGEVGSTPSNNLQIYDPATDTWSTGTNVPTAIGGYPGAVVLGSKIYVAGGEHSTTSGDTLSTLYVYDPSADSWDTGPDMPATLAWLAAVAVDGVMHVIGGNSGPSTSVTAATSHYTFTPSATVSYYDGTTETACTTSYYDGTTETDCAMQIAS